MRIFPRVGQEMGYWRLGGLRGLWERVLGKDGKAMQVFHVDMV